MDEPVNNNPSHTHSSNSEVLAGKPPTKRTAAASSAAPPPKRPYNASNNSDETKDTASSVPENREDNDLLPDDLEVYQELENYEIRYGGNPAQDHHHMQRFYFSYTFLGVGDDAAWEAKFRRLRDKFKNLSEESVEPEQLEEFLLWKKMFARVSDA